MKKNNLDTELDWATIAATMPEIKQPEKIEQEPIKEIAPEIAKQIVQ